MVEAKVDFMGTLNVLLVLRVDTVIVRYVRREIRTRLSWEMSKSILLPMTQRENNITQNFQVFDKQTFQSYRQKCRFNGRANGR